MTRTWAEISLSAIAANFRALSAHPGGAQVMAVVKADAYGHGLIPVARACLAAGAAHFGVATLDEALSLRAAGVSGEIYTLSPLLPGEAEEAARAAVTPFISSPEFWHAFTAAAKEAPLPARAVLMIDTGMGREGMTLEEALVLQPADNVVLAALATHLSSADEDDPAPTRAQLALFEKAVAALDPKGKLPLTWANSPGMLKNFVAPGNLVRAGAALYGIEPFESAFGKVDLIPALAWRARVTLVRDFPAGATIGYGRTATLSRSSKIATVAVGYGDGLHRALGNIGEILLSGRRCRIVGRVSMDQIQVDITDAAEVMLGEVATLLGRDGDEEITAAQMAMWAQTTCHAPTTMLSRRVERRYG